MYVRSIRRLLLTPVDDNCRRVELSESGHVCCCISAQDSRDNIIDNRNEQTKGQSYFFCPGWYPLFLCTGTAAVVFSFEMHRNQLPCTQIRNTEVRAGCAGKPRNSSGQLFRKEAPI